MVSRKTFRSLVDGLYLLGMRMEPVMVVMPMLTTEKQCRRMMDWIALHYQEHPTEEDAIEMAERIKEYYAE